LKIQKIAPLMVCLILCLTPSLFALKGGWKEVGGAKGITAYSRPSYRGGLDEMMAVGMVDAPIGDVETLLRDVPVQREFFYICREATYDNVPGMPNARDSYSTYMRLQFSQPAREHDVVIRWDWSVSKSGRMLHGETAPSRRPAATGAVRIPYISIDYMLVPKGAGMTEVTLSVLMDPGDKVPDPVGSAIVNNMALRSLANLRDIVKRDKYNSRKAAEKLAKEEKEKKEKELQLKLAAQKAAAEKVAAAKAAADKAAAERAIAMKAAAEKIAADKAAAERAAVAKAAAEKAAVAKAVAEKAAMQKASSEKITAQKAATEKASAQKVAVTAQKAPDTAAKPIEVDPSADYQIYKPGRYVFHLKKGTVMPGKWIRTAPGMKAQFEFFADNDNYEILKRVGGSTQVLDASSSETEMSANGIDLKVRGKGPVTVAVKVSVSMPGSR
jgi:hypothetical protein